MNAEMNAPVLSDVNLNKAAGGGQLYGRYIYSNKGDKIGMFYSHKGLYYYPCPKCGKPMHEGTLGNMYCDPCDYWKMTVSLQRWNGTEGELIAAAEEAY